MGMQDREWYRELMRERERVRSRKPVFSVVFPKYPVKAPFVRPWLYQLWFWISVFFLLYKGFKYAGFS